MYLLNKDVLITGGTGSLGKALVSSLSEQGVDKIIIYSRNEYNQHKMEERYPKSQYPIRYFIGDVRDRDRLKRALGRVDICIHAGALKHLDKAQYDPFEAVKTNVFGTQNVIDACIDCSVDKVVLISTDKSEKPSSLYGATKLCSDFMFMSANNYSIGKTKFSAIRFGNFWASSGSIVEKLLSMGKEKPHAIDLTHPEMTRFFISLDDAAGFVIKVLSIMKGSEIFYPKMRARRIIDIMKEIHPKSKINIIGKRPGEKLHEEIIASAYLDKTYEAEHYYVTAFRGIDYKIIGEKLKKVPKNFVYNSLTALSD
jgi:UDP-N-acetylglucosamine 4,6-dehydratase